MRQAVSSLRFEGKIKTLRRIAPPINSTPPPQPSGRPRGLLIAIDGDAETPVGAVLKALQDLLKKAGEFEVLTIEGPRMPGADAGVVAFFESAGNWHAFVPQLRELVFGPVEGVSSVRDNSHMDIDGDEQSEASRSVSANAKTTRSQSTVLGNKGTSESKIPLVMIPRYLLSLSDAWTIALPCIDKYSAENHWQWAATLWRGVPGPDVTIYLKEEGGESQTATPEGRVSTPSGGGKGTVDIVEEFGLMVMKAGKEVDGAALRRVAFEVGEWARSVAAMKA